ncbi:MAG: aspartate aminotransferase family protein [Deltaproteobacteria bacterium]|nr:aspartate aminotransferase family protein [Deltaproteobacteria bacterium]
MTLSTKQSSELFARSRQVMPSGYTRHMCVQKPYPLYADRAEGAWIWDVDGNKRIDYVNNFTASIHGHNRKEIVEVIRDQAGRLMSAIMPTEWEVKLAELLCDRLPSVERVRFMNSGTEAVMIAVKAARAHTGRPKIAKIEGGYHGQFDLIEASFQPMPDKWGPAESPVAVAHNAGTPQSLLNETLVLPLNDIEITTALIEKHADNLSCVLIDPYRTHLGNMEPRVDYLQALRDLTRKHGIVLIFDEVMCLRVGYNGRQGQVEVDPDLTVMGKIIGGGLPIGAVGGSQEVMSVFEVDQGDPLVKHSGTYTANPMSMAAGYVGMSLLTPEAFDDLNARGDRLRAGLQQAIEETGFKASAVGRGAMNGVSLFDELPQNYRHFISLCKPPFMERAMRVQQLLSEEGVLTMRGMLISSTPMTDADVQFTVAAAKRAFSRMAAEEAK